jgi:hypothetical protein
MDKQIVSLDFMPNTMDETAVVMLNPLAKPNDVLAEASKRLMMLKATLMITADRGGVALNEVDAEYFFLHLAQTAHESMVMVDHVASTLTGQSFEQCLGAMVADAMGMVDQAKASRSGKANPAKQTSEAMEGGDDE